jgi:segregation and condensation protein A
VVDEPIIPHDAGFRITLPTFEGPLDLLLHLIKKHELEVLDLPISFVTERYLEYLQMMQELDLDVASEYLLMAATLAHIKSKMLLPPSPLDEVEEQDEAYMGDPREELIKRLLEYQKYRAAAEELGSRPLEGRDVFARGMPAPEADGPAPLASFDLYKLLDAFQSILKRVHGRVALEVTAEAITIHERMSQLSDLLRVRRNCTFVELFEGARTRYEVVVTFLALLEMTKLHMTRIYQTHPDAPIHVQFALLDADAPTIPPPGSENQAMSALDEIIAASEIAAREESEASAPTELKADAAHDEDTDDDDTDDDDDDLEEDDDDESDDEDTDELDESDEPDSPNDETPT